MRPHFDRLASCLTLLALLFPAASASPSPVGLQREQVEQQLAEISEEQLAELAAEASAAVSEVTGVPLDGLVVRFASRRELGKILRAELEPRFAAIFSDPEVAQQQLTTTVAYQEASVIAKFVLCTGEIVVCAENLRESAKLIGKPRLASPEILRVILAHEAVHAADERVHGIANTYNRITTRDGLLGYAAVIEGHAQLVARKVCAEEGWGADFESFTDLIDDHPKIGEVNIDYTMEVLASARAWKYYVGETFVAYLAEHGGEEAVARAFCAPPTETILIEEPAWYLDPTKRPKLVHELGTPLRLFNAFVDERWTSQVIPLSRVDLEPGFDVLPRESVTPVLAQISQAVVVTQVAKDTSKGTTVVTSGLFEAASGEAAAAFLKLEEQLMRKKDELATSGTPKIEDAIYRPIALGMLTGFYRAKRFTSGAEELFAQTVMLRRDLVVLELSLVGDKWDEQQAISLGRTLIEAAHRSRRVVEQAK